MESYYYLVDNSTQWFTEIVAVENEKPRERISIEPGLTGQFISNLLAREPNFTNKLINGSNWYGWSISRKEFDRLKRLCELYPKVQEYNKLLSYN